VGELDDVFAEVGLEDVDTVGLEGLIEVDLLAGHRLALDHHPRATTAEDALDGGHRLTGVGGPVDVAAACLEVGRPAVQEIWELLNRAIANRPSNVAQPLRICQLGERAPATIDHLPRHVPHRGPEADVAEGDVGPGREHGSVSHGRAPRRGELPRCPGRTGRLCPGDGAGRSSRSRPRDGCPRQRRHRASHPPSRPRSREA
jgi:hypothetical protein